MNKNQHKPPLSWSLIGVFVIVSAIIIFLGFMFINSQRERILNDKKEELRAIADLKVGQISEWRHERVGDAVLIQDNSSLIDQISNFFNKSDNQKERIALLRWLNSIINNYDYYSAAIIDSKGKVRLSVPAKDSVLGSFLSPLIPVALKERKVILTDLHRIPPDNYIHLDLLAPLIKKQGNDSITIGMVVLRIDPQNILYPLVTSWPTRSKTSETLLLRQNDDSVIYLNELKHITNSALLLTRPVTEKNFIGALAIRGFSGTTEGIDYRNEPVIADIKKVPESSWYMVAKVDIAEINSIFREQMGLAGLIIIFFVSAFGAIIGWTIWHQRVRYYRNRYQAERERLALRKHFDYILKYANDIVLLIDSNHIIVEVNDHALEVYQYTRDELIGMNVAMLRLPELTSQLEENLKILKEVGFNTYETIHRRKDGTTFPVEISARMFEIEGVDYYQSIGRDITERKKIEQSLNQLLERYNLATQAARLAVWDWDIVNDHLIWDDRVYELYGVTKEEFPPVYNSWLKVLHPQDIEKANGDIERAIKNNCEYNTEFRVIHSDGSVKYIKAFGQVVRGGVDSPLRMIGINYDITEQKIAENLLREREFWLSESQRIGKIGSYIFDIETLRWTSSEVLDEIFGIDENFPRTLDGWNQLVHPDFRDEMLEYVKNYVIEQKNVFKKEYKLINHSTGKECWVYGSGELSFRPDGSVEKMFGTIQDITERKIAEQSIIESEERFRKIFEESPFAIAMTSIDFKIMKVNAAFCNMMGYNEEELISLTFMDFSHPEYVAKDEESLRLLVESKIPIYRTEKRYKRKDNSIIWGSTTLNTIVDSNGQIQYLLAMIEDITLRKNSEIELEKSLSLLRATIESTDDGLLVVDVAGKIVLYNAKFAEIWKIPKEVLETKDDNLALNFVLDQLKDPDKFISTVKHLYSSPEKITSDILEFKDGRVFERYSQPQKINNVTVGRVWSFRDITNRKMAESQLIAAKEKAEESDRLKTAFLHNISHEIRTPMNAIVGFTALIDEPDLDTETRKQFINIIYQSTNQLLSIITDIVDISNIETNQVKLTYDEVEINSVIKSLYEQFTIIANKQKLLLRYEVSLPDEKAIITTDKTKLIQIISNLLNNAFKFTKQGTVVFGYRISGDKIEFFVKDTGIGVSADKQLRIFDRFYQVENHSSRQFSGAGLGLSICKAYVELLGGTIWLKSAPDKGSEFCFTLPYTL